MVDIDDYNRVADCIYKNENYSARDNGAVLRHPRKNKPLRKWDNQWTFGTPNEKGYLQIASEVVHRIVAYAFLGEPPTSQHIVDHRDTNRQNNRPENLRWLTKLENVLNNPITVKKIIFYCGSIEAFIEDPSILRKYVDKDPNFGWMRTVTPEEARNSWQRMNHWANTENSNSSFKGGSMGEWIYEDYQYSDPFQESPEFVTSQTPNAIQKDWKTPSEFPCCPKERTDNPIGSYAANLKTGKIFSRNQHSTSTIVDFATSEDNSTLWIMCKNSDDKAVKPWLLAQVTYENGLFVHQSLGSFFQKDGAEKYFTLAQGLEWTGGETFDDSVS